MAKVSKDKLKALIKECLVEILNEGLAGSLSSQKTSSLITGDLSDDDEADPYTPKKVVQKMQQQQKRTIADDRRIQESKGSSVAARATNVPILQEMLSDPATLAAARNMRGASETGGGAGSTIDTSDQPGIPAEKIEALGNSSNWAAIAFAQTRRPGMP